MNALLLKLFNEYRIFCLLAKSKDISAEIKYVLVQSYVRVISASFDATSDYIAIGHLAIDDFHYRTELKRNNTANYSKIHKLYPQLKSI